MTEQKTETYEEVISDQTVTQQQKANISGNLTSLTVEELYDKDKFDLSTMEPGDIFELLQYVSFFFFLSFYFYIFSPLSFDSIFFLGKSFPFIIFFLYLLFCYIFNCSSKREKIIFDFFIFWLDPLFLSLVIEKKLFFSCCTYPGKKLISKILFNYFLWLIWWDQDFFLLLRYF